MADLRIVDAPLLSTVKGTEKIPTGGEGNFSVSVNQVADFAKLKWFLATEEYVDNAVGNVQADLNLHKNNISNPHQVTKSQVGLANVDNTADLDKPVSNATQSAIITANSGKADKSYVDSQDQLKADKVDLKASKISSDGNQTQQAINDFGGAKWYNKSSGYELGATVKLENGDTVKSTVANNVANPNVDMMGWIKTTDPKNIKFTDINSPSNNLFNKLRIITPYVFGAKGDRVTDDTAAIQAFWNYIATNLVETADVTGDFLISGDIFTDTGTNIFWKDKPIYVQNIVGHMTLRPNGYVSNNAVLHFKGFRDTDFRCKISVICPGSSNYATRKNGMGVIFENCSRVDACHLEVWYTAGRAVIARGTTSVFNFASIDCWYCGATAGATGANNIALDTPTYVHTGTSGNTNQRTEITVAPASIPSALQVDDFVMFFNSAAKYSELKQIKSIDLVNNKITVFPWVYSSDEAYTPYYIIGGGFYAEGGDTSAATIGRISSVSCGVSCNSQSLYPVSIFNHVTQYCGIGFASGKGASEGGVTTNMYCEASGLNDLACSGNAKYTYISIGPEAEEWKFSHLQAAVTSGDQRIRGNATSPRIYGKTGQMPLGSNGQLANGATQFSPTISTGSPTPISLFVNQSEGGGARGTTVYLNYNDIKNREFGLDTVWVLLHSSTASGAMSGNAIFAPVSGQSYTVNGQATWSTPINGPTLFCCRYVAGDWRVFRFDGVVDGQQTSKTASATYDPPSLAAAGTAGDFVTTAVNLTGAVLGNNVSAAFSRFNAAIEISAQVSATNVVTVKFRNTGTTAVDLASGTLTVKLI